MRRGHAEPRVLLFALGRHWWFLDSSSAASAWPQEFCHRESGWKTTSKGWPRTRCPRSTCGQRDVQKRAVPRERIPFRQTRASRTDARVFLGNSGSRHTTWAAALEGIPSIPEHRRARKAHGDRLSSIDLRFGKNLRYGNGKTAINSTSTTCSTDTTEVFQRSYTPRPRHRGHVSRSLQIMSRAVLQDQAQFDFDLDAGAVLSLLRHLQASTPCPLRRTSSEIS